MTISRNMTQEQIQLTIEEVGLCNEFISLIKQEDLAGLQALVDLNRKFLDKLPAFLNSQEFDDKYYKVTCLQFAVEKRNVDIASFLIELGADVNESGSDEETPLSIATGNGDLDMIKLLLDAGADVNKENNPLSQIASPLWASFYRYRSFEKNIPILKHLIDVGANVNSKNVEFTTPLIHLLVGYARLRKKMPDTAQEYLQMLDVILEAGAGIYCHLNQHVISKLRLVNLEDKILISDPDAKIKITRATPGCERAITNLKELQDAIQRGVPFNSRAIRNTCLLMLKRYPEFEDDGIKELCTKLIAILNMFPDTSFRLDLLCLKYLNSREDMLLYRYMALTQAILPSELKVKLNPVDEMDVIQYDLAEKSQQLLNKKSQALHEKQLRLKFFKPKDSLVNLCLNVLNFNDKAKDDRKMALEKKKPFSSNLLTFLRPVEDETVVEKKSQPEKPIFKNS